MRYSDLGVTEADIRQAQETVKDFSLEETRDLMEKVLKIHELDPNFPLAVLDKIKLFLGNPDVFDNPEKHSDLIKEIKIEAALITNNSPYAEVRAVVDNTDDPNIPSVNLFLHAPSTPETSHPSSLALHLKAC